MASRHSNMRKLSKGHAQWRQHAVNHESAVVLSHYPNRVTPRFPREARPVFWKCGRSVSPSSFTTWPKSIKRQPQILRLKLSITNNPSRFFGTFPRLFARLTHSLV